MRWVTAVTLGVACAHALLFAVAVALAWRWRASALWYWRARGVVWASGTAAVLLGAHVAAREVVGGARYPCVAHALLVHVLLPAYAVPYFLRSWRIVILQRRNAYSLRMARLDGDGSITQEEDVRWWAFALAGSRRRTLTLALAVWVPLQAGAALLLLQLTDLRRAPLAGCHLGVVDFTWLAGVWGVFLLVAIVSALCIRRHSDAFALRSEVLVVFLVWLVLGAPYLAANVAGAPLDTYAAPLFELLLLSTSACSLLAPSFAAARARRGGSMTLWEAVARSERRAACGDQYDDFGGAYDPDARSLIGGDVSGMDAFITTRDVAMCDALSSDGDDAAAAAAAPWHQRVPTNADLALVCLTESAPLRYFSDYLTSANSLNLLLLWRALREFQEVPADQGARRRQVAQMIVRRFFTRTEPTHVLDMLQAPARVAANVVGAVVRGGGVDDAGDVALFDNVRTHVLDMLGRHYARFVESDEFARLSREATVGLLHKISASGADPAV